ncbi:DUF6241 domain-containing protein [Alkalibacillus haloalkaliphilus]|uniref:Uncharacterized protein n=1 Tax=Alkalibacillus haloalkaliphilus TaxID=94136 RepID=A0A511W113_9BACI|nr:DUF6241 domain-containing protein [Alkalibacillus haloalkaliphilus]GEN44421.1 hypothetical protein AHA02nite_01970 [Alkalibacillus haloalkaliphilus]
MTIYKWIVGTLLTILLSIVIFFAVVVLLDRAEASSEDEEREALPVGRIVDAEEEDDEEEIDRGEVHTVELNPFGEPVSQSELTKHEVRDYIHKMSHQKIEADIKRGFYLITDERIQWLIDGVEQARGEMPGDDVYLDILSRWAQDDFSRVDEDHNVIWNMQNGEIGEATGILNEEEERAYIEANLSQDRAAYEEYRDVYLDEE